MGVEDACFPSAAPLHQSTKAPDLHHLVNPRRALLNLMGQALLVSSLAHVCRACSGTSCHTPMHRATSSRVVRSSHLSCTNMSRHVFPRRALQRIELQCLLFVSSVFFFLLPIPFLSVKYWINLVWSGDDDVFFTTTHKPGQESRFKLGSNCTDAHVYTLEKKFYVTQTKSNWLFIKHFFVSF